VEAALKPASCWDRGGIGKPGMARMTDSAGVLEHGKGAGRVAWEPSIATDPTACPRSLDV
jgi:hypothetical protein